MMERLIRANHWLTALVGWRRYGVSVFFGVLAALALPPVYAVIFLVPAFVGLIWLVDSSSGLRGAFAVGWWFGFGHFVAGLYWIGIALSVKADQFGWLIPFAVFGLPAVIACYTAVIAMLAKAMQSRGLSWVPRCRLY
jgi:apolipoprotein N-acyltransferase